MDRGRKAMPSSNRLLTSRWNKHLAELHKKQLKTVKPCVDNRPPRRYWHLVAKPKKTQIEEERYEQIEHENRLLLDKMSSIMTHDVQNLSPPRERHHPKSLNREFRKRELLKITTENVALLRRIQSKEPFYNHLEWEEDARLHQHIVRNICQYDYQLLPSQDSLLGPQIHSENSTEHNEGIYPMDSKASVGTTQSYKSTSRAKQVSHTPSRTNAQGRAGNGTQSARNPPPIQEAPHNHRSLGNNNHATTNNHKGTAASSTTSKPSNYHKAKATGQKQQAVDHDAALAELLYDDGDILENKVHIKPTHTTHNSNTMHSTSSSSSATAKNPSSTKLASQSTKSSASLHNDHTKVSASAANLHDDDDDDDGDGEGIDDVRHGEKEDFAAVRPSAATVALSGGGFDEDVHDPARDRDLLLSDDEDDDDNDPYADDFADSGPLPAPHDIHAHDLDAIEADTLRHEAGMTEGDGDDVDMDAGRDNREGDGNGNDNSRSASALHDDPELHDGDDDGGGDADGDDGRGDRDADIGKQDMNDDGDDGVTHATDTARSEGAADMPVNADADGNVDATADDHLDAAHDSNDNTDATDPKDIDANEPSAESFENADATAAADHAAGNEDWDRDAAGEGTDTPFESGLHENADFNRDDDTGNGDVGPQNDDDHNDEGGNDASKTADADGTLDPPVPQDANDIDSGDLNSRALHDDSMDHNDHNRDMDVDGTAAQMEMQGGSDDHVDAGGDVEGDAGQIGQVGQESDVNAHNNGLLDAKDDDAPAPVNGDENPEYANDFDQDDSPKNDGNDNDTGKL